MVATQHFVEGVLVGITLAVLRNTPGSALRNHIWLCSRDQRGAEFNGVDCVKEKCPAYCTNFKFEANKIFSHYLDFILKSLIDNVLFQIAISDSISDSHVSQKIL